MHRAVEAYDKRQRLLEGRIAQLTDQLQDARSAHEQYEKDRLAACNVWRQCVAPTPPSRVEVIGGTRLGWEALVLTHGASLLGSGARLLVLDFSERGVATLLERLAAEAGHRTRRLSLPTQAANLDLFTGLSPGELVECVVSAWHDIQDNNTADMTTDAFLLEQVARCIEFEGTVTVPRLYMALTALLRLELPGNEQAPQHLTDEEVLRLERLLRTAGTRAAARQSTAARHDGVLAGAAHRRPGRRCTRAASRAERRPEAA